MADAARANEAMDADEVLYGVPEPEQQRDDESDRSDDDDDEEEEEAPIPTPEEVQLEYTYPQDFQGRSWQDVVQRRYFRLIIDPACIDIPDEKFLNCRYLIEIVYPEEGKDSKLLLIGTWAFERCCNLQRMNPFPDGLVELGDYAFSDCCSLQGRITLPPSIRLVRERCFAGCKAITSVIFDSSTATTTPVELQSDILNRSRMKRKSSTRGGGGGDDEKWEGGTNKKHSSSSCSSNNDGYKTSKKKKHPPPPVIGTVATRTHHQTEVIASSRNQPISILIHIMGYADPDTVRMLCCVSKKFYDLIANHPGMEHNRVIPLLQISPSEDQEDFGRVGRLVHFLYRHCDQLQRYLEIKIIDANKFFGLRPYIEWLEVKKITGTLRLHGIVSLDLSSPPPSTYIAGENAAHPDYFDLCYFFLSKLPNLRDVNLSNIGCPSASHRDFSSKCPNLEKITWHNINCRIDIDGGDMMHASNLKEMYMDGSVFSMYRDDERHQLSDLENDENSNIFLFHKLSSSKLLERVSIRNAKWYFVYSGQTVIPQNALIKFVRNAPTSLRWFRSNLTQENMMMLRSERPGIELVN